MKQDQADKKDQADKDHEKIEYQYWKDSEGKIRRFKKMDYQPRAGFVRLKFFEKYYFWWKRKSFDFKNAIVPWFMGFTAVYIIYKTSMLWSQNDLQRQIKAKLPFEYSSDVVDEMKKLKKDAH